MTYDYAYRSYGRLVVIMSEDPLYYFEINIEVRILPYDMAFISVKASKKLY